MYLREASKHKKERHDFSFPKHARILKRSEFLFIARRGKRCVGRFFVIHLHPNTVNRPRVGITVSRKVGGAVTRNRIKRRVREFFRLHQHELPASTDILVVARKGCGDLTQSMISLGLKSLLIENKGLQTRSREIPKDDGENIGCPDQSI